MLLIIEASQMAFPDIEVVVQHFKSIDYDIVLSGLERSRHITEPLATIIDDVDEIVLYKESTTDCVMRCYQELMNERDMPPELTHIISNRGADLAVAILLGTEFTWGFDLTSTTL